ncbi:SCO family protein [Methylobacterium gossipiicola]|uniref:Cytochrome oxidase Cu insertion factor, SCO1/SenC/PrrC family n=1 Tax=Methylobacterium gossipiicola TaxID=582675 RepID=A0A1I2X293_9HYPH|nr:SCO family protein [Methylobacterium gossipiicola]SFH07660.1 Cytochrome oxidase Cu insertion factor, SCO1/SenC/PrrC family [Methylobacterium gossipiicola]
MSVRFPFIAGLVCACLTMASGQAASPGPRSDIESFLWSEGAPAPRDQTGGAFGRARLADRLTVVNFITTDCAIPCVVRIRDLAKTFAALPEPLKARVTIVSVTLAPERDDVARLRSFAEGLGLDAAHFLFLASDPATATRQRAALRYAADNPEPPATVLVFDRTGQFAMNYGADPLDGERLARDLAELDRFENGVGHPPRQATAPP